MIVGMEPNVPVEPMLMTASEVAALMQISVRSLWRLRSAGLVPEPVRLGGTVRWRTAEVRNWIAEGCPAPQARENDTRRN